MNYCLSQDDAGNIVASEPSRMNISTIRGAAPSGFIIYSSAPAGSRHTKIKGRIISEFCQRLLGNNQTTGRDSWQPSGIFFIASANSFIHLSARATDSDGEIEDVSLKNNKFLGTAERQHNSHHYVPSC